MTVLLHDCNSADAIKTQTYNFFSLYFLYSSLCLPWIFIQLYSTYYVYVDCEAFTCVQLYMYFGGLHILNIIILNLVCI